MPSCYGCLPPTFRPAWWTLCSPGSFPGLPLQSPDSNFPANLYFCLCSGAAWFLAQSWLSINMYCFKRKSRCTEVKVLVGAWQDLVSKIPKLPRAGTQWPLYCLQNFCCPLGGVRNYLPLREAFWSCTWRDDHKRALLSDFFCVE